MVNVTSSNRFVEIVLEPDVEFPKVLGVQLPTPHLTKRCYHPRQIPPPRAAGFVRHHAGSSCQRKKLSWRVLHVPKRFSHGAEISTLVLLIAASLLVAFLAVCANPFIAH